MLDDETIERNLEDEQTSDRIDELEKRLAEYEAADRVRAYAVESAVDELEAIYRDVPFDDMRGAMLFVMHLAPKGSDVRAKIAEKYKLDPELPLVGGQS